MRIGIVTIHSMNLGNRLQNYALQEYLKGKGVKVETFQRTIDRRSNIKKLKNNVSSYIKRDKISNFRWFDKKIHWSKDVVTKEYVSEGIGNRYDYIVAGSDQIWNPNFDFNSELDFMVFVPREKRVSYAASFGVSRIEEAFIEPFRKMISEIPHRSVREVRGQEIIKELTGLDSEVMPDPTMLLTKTKWVKAERKPAFNVGEKFFFVYFIGQYDKNVRAYIHERAFSCGAEVVEIVKDRSELDGKIGPAEFLWLIHHSEQAFTDSYHGSVLTLLLQRKYLSVFSRKSKEADMSSRFDTLWDMLGIADKIQKIDQITCIKEDAMIEVDRRQVELIKKADIFLNQAIFKCEE